MINREPLLAVPPPRPWPQQNDTPLVEALIMAERIEPHLMVLVSGELVDEIIEKLRSLSP